MAYLTITSIFQKNNSELTAAEAHGLASGMLCIRSGTEAGLWLAELFAQDCVLADDDKTVLVALFEQTRALLNATETSFRYDLFLPDDDEPLVHRLEAIRYWCEGFLFGVGYQRLALEWSAEATEFMQDMIEFTKLNTAVEHAMDDAESDQHEAALMEIQEYLRVGVHGVKDQFSNANGGNSQQ